MKENALVGHVVGAVAMSPESQDNDVRNRDEGSVRYSLTSATPRNPYGPSSMLDGSETFEIDKSSGYLVVSRTLDRETQGEYRLEVRALDTSASNNPQSSAVTVRVEIEDVNDNAPFWPSNPIVLHLPEDTPVSSVVSNVSATDNDYGPNADLRYNLVKTFPDSSTFTVDSLTGIVTLNGPLDYEDVSEYILVVRATDQAVNISERLTTSVTFIVRVLDANDNAPVFLSPSSGFYAMEDGSAPGTAIGKIIAVDNDTGENGRVRYSIDDERFTIHADSGLLSLNSPNLRKGTVTLNVTATDHGRPALKAVLSLRIAVQGSAENPPKFTKSTYFAKVAEDVPIGTFVTRVEAAVPGQESGTNCVLACVNRERKVGSGWNVSVALLKTSIHLDAVSILISG